MIYSLLKKTDTTKNLKNEIMKIVAINGSPKGKTSNTNTMVNSFLTGAQEAGAETFNIFLAEKEINYCKGCYSCWFKSPGECIIKDDMTDIISHLAGANIIVLASPLYFNNISGTLKVFMDRLTVTGSPHPPKAGETESKNDKTVDVVPPKLVMMSNCGFPDRSQFQVVSLWIKRVAAMMQTNLIGEIYAVQGKLLSNPTDELRPAIDRYLKLLESAGKEIALNLKLSETTENLLQYDFTQN
jgi:putative NADPH-quinone reductase